MRKQLDAYQAMLSRPRRLLIGLQSRGRIKLASDVLGMLSVELAAIARRNEKDSRLTLAAGFEIALASRALLIPPGTPNFYINPGQVIEEDPNQPVLSLLQPKP